MDLSTVKVTASEIRAEQERRHYNKIESYFPDIGPLRRELYPKHMEFFYASSLFRETCFMAANRSGKSESGAYAVTCHLTGRYPHWWKGRKFNKVTNILVAGETGKLVRDSIQRKLLGPINDIGSGMIPREYIVDWKPKAGIPDAIDTVEIKHISGRNSLLQFQSYDQKREAFQATERDVVWLDEEPDISIYSECLIRTMTTNGIVMLTFTPLKGISETVLNMQEKAAANRAAVVTATWDDCAHLSEKDKTELMASLPPHQRDARAKGIPQLGSGAIYPVLESEITSSPFPIPYYWPQAYALDVGWNNTAVLWGAHDPDKDVWYITGEYKRGQAEPAVHAAAIKARGEWIPGVIDPASRGRAQADGEQLLTLYQNSGLLLTTADNTVEAGIYDVYQRLTTGRLKIFNSCVQFFHEYRLYRRDDKGKVVKENDHLMDCLRYLIRSAVGVPSYKGERTQEQQPRGEHTFEYNPLAPNYINSQPQSVQRPNTMSFYNGKN